MLVACLILMMLLIVLFSGSFALAKSQKRVSAQAVLQAQARQQALLGLDAALAELQLNLGPDCRVTANSSILNNHKCPYILGVWDSWDAPLYGTGNEGKAKGKKIDSTYTEGRDKMFRRWLISSADPTKLTSVQGADSLGTRMAGKRICLVGDGTLGNDGAGSSGMNRVYADLVDVPSGTSYRTSYAWWIGAENQKAKISIRNPEIKNEADALRATWNAPAPIFKREGFNVGETAENPEKLLTMRTLHNVVSNGEFGMPYFFDVTTTSYSLPVDVRNGGLKQDLCLLLGKEENFRAAGNEFYADMNASSDRPLVPHKDLEGARNKGGIKDSNVPIGSWQTMYAYYNCWPKTSEKEKSNDSNNVTARLIRNGDEVYTRISGVAYPNGSSSDDQGKRVYEHLEKSTPTGGASIFDTRALMHATDASADVRNSAGYARMPVMLSYMCTFGLVTEERIENGNPILTTDQKPSYRLSMSFAPMFLWWNPYNVPMRIRNNQLWAQSIPYKCIWLQTYANSTQSSYEYKWGTYAMSKKTGDTGFGDDYGNYFQSNGGQELVFQPGEILFFAPQKPRSAAENTQPFNNPFVNNYNPSAVSDYNARFYSKNGGKSTDLTIASAENINAGHFKLGIRLGIDGAGAYTTDGVYFAPNVPEAITVMNGVAGTIDPPSSWDTAENKRGHNPQRFLLGWYDPKNAPNTVICDPENGGVWRADGTQSDKNIPYFVAAVGVVPKSANQYLDTALFPGEDFRTKSWLHSSPAFWGSFIVNPSNQQRQYNPYQLAVLDVGSGMNACPMDNVGRNGILGINSGGEQVSLLSVLELPVHPPFSLAGFSGMRLSPGWFQSPNIGSRPVLRRVQYQSGVPGVGIGNAFADPCIGKDSVCQFFSNNKIPFDNGGNDQIFSDFYDHGLLINDALWDRWFCSSISDMPYGSKEMTAKQVAEEFFGGKAKSANNQGEQKFLPVARLVKTKNVDDSESIVSKIDKDKEIWKYIAQYLMVDGGFNVNSTSVDAWAAALQGLAGRCLVHNANGKLEMVEGSSSDNTDSVMFPRFMVSTSIKPIETSGYSMMEGSTDFRGSKVESGAAAWGDIRELTQEDITDLAEMIVEQVRERGPFLNMSDFINRRLSSKNVEHAKVGALQAAIDRTNINECFNDVQAVAQGGGDLYRFKEAEEGSIYTAAPGYLIQSDILLSLGNVLTVRDDTFTIRAYGCVRTGGRGRVLAQAWCEAVVQRTIEYVDPSNEPQDRDRMPDGSAPKKKLTAINKTLGRKFRVVSFKWLDAWDI